MLIEYVRRIFKVGREFNDGECVEPESHGGKHEIF